MLLHDFFRVRPANVPVIAIAGIFVAWRLMVIGFANILDRWQSNGFDSRYPVQFYDAKVVKSVTPQRQNS